MPGASRWHLEVLLPRSSVTASLAVDDTAGHEATGRFAEVRVDVRPAPAWRSGTSSRRADGGEGVAPVDRSGGRWGPRRAGATMDRPRSGICTLRDPRSPGLACRSRPPVELEALAVPTQNGLGFHDDERSLPLGPMPGQPAPEDAVAAAELGPANLVLVDVELLTERRDLEQEIRSGSQGRSKDASGDAEYVGHGPSVVAPRPQKVNDYGPDGIIAEHGVCTICEKTPRSVST